MIQRLNFVWRAALCIAIGATTGTTLAQEARKQFAERMGAVKEGMPPMQVTKILGSPDTVWTEKTKTPFRFANV